MTIECIEWADGRREWRFHGRLHRPDGPAYIGADGTKAWWIDGKKYSLKEWCVQSGKTKQEIVELLMVN